MTREISVLIGAVALTVASTGIYYGFTWLLSMAMRHFTERGTFAVKAAATPRKPKQQSKVLVGTSQLLLSTVGASATMSIAFSQPTDASKAAPGFWLVANGADRPTEGLAERTIGADSSNLVTAFVQN